MIALFLMVALLVYIIVATLAVRVVEKMTKSRIAKYLTIAVFVLIPTWDIVPGRLYFQHLCEKEAGVKVLKTVEVEKSYFKLNGDPDEGKLSDRFRSSMKVDRKVPDIFHITKIESSIQEKQSGETLGIATDLGYFGGWISACLFPQGPPAVCPSYPVHDQKWKEVFKRKPDIAQGGN